MMYWLFVGAAAVLTACVSPSSSSPSGGAGGRGGRAPYAGPPPTYGAEAVRTPATAAQPAAASYDGGAYENTAPPPDGQMLYQRRRSDAFGSRSFSSSTQIRGPVSEEVYLGNQRVDGPDGMVRIYDPRTGRMRTVSRP